jgi:hypothetical protein
VTDAESIASQPVDPGLFAVCVQYVQSHHQNMDPGEGLIETIHLLAQYLREHEVVLDRKWEVMFAITTRMLALIALIKDQPLQGQSLTDVTSQQIWTHPNVLRLAATATLVEIDGEWAFDRAAFQNALNTASPKHPYDWDDEKARQNETKHGVSFAAVYGFDWSTAIEAEDARYDYGETRMQALGRIAQKYHVLVYTMRGDRIRIISLRKANKRELP